MSGVIKIRSGQKEFQRGIEEHRICGFLTRRQYGKTTNAALISLKKMMRKAGHTVVFGSVKLDLGREIVRKEAEAIHRAIAQFEALAKAQKTKLDVVDEKGKTVVDVSADDFADLYESSRLEFRVYHSNSVYSRTKVVALTPEAVGDTGDLILDEVGRVRRFREVWEAVKPIISSNPEFRCILTTTPPPDDTHYSFELLAPPIGGEFPANPKGNWYRSDLGVWVLRVTAWDAAADGIPLYDDDTGKEITPEDSRAKDHDKDAWDRNYAVKFVVGGTAACSLVLLDVAQRRGMEKETVCEFFLIENDSDMVRAQNWLAQHLGSGKVGLGWDLATTEKATSNPSSVAVVEGSGSEDIVRAIFTWKTNDPGIQEERIRMIVQGVKHRREGGRARRLCIDATNERLFSAQMKRALAAELPVTLVVGSETIERPGAEPMNMKQFLGGLLVGRLEDNHLTLPPARYVREDFRLVKKERGSFVCEPDASGRHGDTFDATKLGVWAKESDQGALTTMDGIFSGGSTRGVFVPRGVGTYLGR